MVGKTNHGYCLRENLLYYQDFEPDDRDPNYSKPCRMPLTDGKVCGDLQDTKTEEGRCPYNRKCGLDLDTTNMVYITYPSVNKDK